MPATPHRGNSGMAGQLDQIQIEMLIKARDDATRVLKQVNATLAQAGVQTNNITGNFQKATTAARQAGIAITAAFTQVAAIKNILGTGIQIESEFVNVGRTAELSTAQLDELKGATKELAQELKAVPLQNLLHAEVLAGQAGVVGTKNILSLTKALAVLQAVNPELATDEQAEKFAKFAQLTKTTGDGVLNLASALTQLSNKSVSSADDILGVALQLKQSTSAYNLTAKEILGIATAASQTGFKAEITGGVIGRTLAQVDTAAAGNSAAFKRLSDLTGIQRSEFQRLIATDPAKAFTLTLKALHSLGTDTSQYTDLLKQLGLYAIQNRTVLGALTSQYGQLAEFIDIANTAGKDSAAIMSNFNARVNATQGGVTNAANALKFFAFSITEALKPLLDPALNDFASAIYDISDSLDTMSPTLQKVVAGALVFAPTIILATSAIMLFWKALKLLMIIDAVKWLGGLAASMITVETAAYEAAAAQRAMAAASLYEADAAATAAAATIGFGEAAGAVAVGVATLAADVFAVVGALLLLKQHSKDIDGLGIKVFGDNKLGQFFATDFVGTFHRNIVMQGEHAGENFFTGVKEYAQNDKGEWFKIKEDRIASVAKEAGKGFSEAFQTDWSGAEVKIDLPKAKRSAEDAAKVVQNAFNAQDPKALNNILYDLNKMDKSIGKNVPDALAHSIDKFDELNKQAAELADQQDALNYIKELLDGGFKVKLNGHLVEPAELTRMQNLLDITKRLADPAAQIAHDVGIQTAELLATTAAARDRLEVEKAILDVYEKTGEITEAQRKTITDALQAQQAARKAADVEAETRSVERSLATARERTEIGRQNVEIENKLADLARDKGITDLKTLSNLRDQLQLLNQINSLHAIEDQTQPLVAANRQYQESLITLKKALDDKTISQEQSDQMTRTLAAQTLAERDPIGERVRLMRDEISLIGLRGRAREAEAQTQKDLNDLLKQGVKPTQELHDAFLAFNKAALDADAAAKTGVEGFLNSVGELKDNLNDVVKSGLDGLSEKLADFVTTGKGGFKELGESLLAELNKIAFKQAIAQLLKATGIDFNQGTNDALKKATDNLEKANQESILNTVNATVNAQIVNIGGVDLQKVLQQAADTAPGILPPGAQPPVTSDITRSPLPDVAPAAAGLSEDAIKKSFGTGGVDAAIKAAKEGFAKIAAQGITDSAKGNRVIPKAASDAISKHVDDVFGGALTGDPRSAQVAQAGIQQQIDNAFKGLSAPNAKTVETAQDAIQRHIDNAFGTGGIRATPAAGAATAALNDNQSVASIVKQLAPKIGVDTATALKVIRSEGGLGKFQQSQVFKNGIQEPSFGPFQLLKGGPGTGFKKGLGNLAPFDVSDPSTIRQNVQFGLEQAKKNGWSQWYGAAKAGVGKWDGIDRTNPNDKIAGLGQFGASDQHYPGWMKTLPEDFAKKLNLDKFAGGRQSNNLESDLPGSGINTNWDMLKKDMADGWQGAKDWWSPDKTDYSGAGGPGTFDALKNADARPPAIDWQSQGFNGPANGRYFDFQNNNQWSQFGTTQPGDINFSGDNQSPFANLNGGQGGGSQSLGGLDLGKLNDSVTQAADNFAKLNTGTVDLSSAFDTGQSVLSQLGTAVPSATKALDSFGTDAVTQAGQAAVKTATDTLTMSTASTVTAPAITALGSAASAAAANMGGSSLANGVGDISHLLPKFHDGGSVLKRMQSAANSNNMKLKSDEVPAILQTGEVVLSRENVKMMNSLPWDILQNAPRLHTGGEITPSKIIQLYQQEYDAEDGPPFFQKTSANTPFNKGPLGGGLPTADVYSMHTNTGGSYRTGEKLYTGEPKEKKPGFNFESLLGLIPMLFGLFGGGSGGGLFGGLSFGMPGSVPTYTGADAGSLLDLLKGFNFHSGGEVGNGGTARSIPAHMIAGAPRFHDGNLASDEFLAVLQKGEKVLSNRNQRDARQNNDMGDQSMGNGRESANSNWNGGPTIVQHIQIVANDPNSFRSTLSQTSRQIRSASDRAMRRDG